jgi:hypothetical protein
VAGDHGDLPRRVRRQGGDGLVGGNRTG